MRRTTTVVLAALGVALAGVLLLRGQQAMAQAPEAPDGKRTIHTSGTATVRVKPDAARVFFGVQTLASTVKAARTENNSRVQKVLAALRQLEIPDLKMKSTNVQLDLERRNRSGDIAADVVGYRITNSFTVLVENEDPEKLATWTSRILDTALENGANQVEQVVFLKQNEEEARRQALAKAVQAALANARALAGGAGTEVRQTITIQGQPEYHFGGSRMMQNTMLPAGGETPLVAGDLQVSCSVSVTCAF